MPYRRHHATIVEGVTSAFSAAIGTETQGFVMAILLDTRPTERIIELTMGRGVLFSLGRRKLVDTSRQAEQTLPDPPGFPLPGRNSGFHWIAERYTPRRIHAKHGIVGNTVVWHDDAIWRHHRPQGDRSASIIVFNHAILVTLCRHFMSCRWHRDITDYPRFSSRPPPVILCPECHARRSVTTLSDSVDSLPVAHRKTWLAQASNAALRSVRKSLR